jgi:cytochrome c biogenesis protein CcmG, thiol:disulfide interchange protein DsbE
MTEPRDPTTRLPDADAPLTRSSAGTDATPEANGTTAPGAAAPTAAAPAFTHRPPRKGLIGPFGGRQIVGGLLAVALVAVGLAAVTAPIGSARTSTQPDPRPTPYLIGPAAEGLHVGDQAPEFSTTRSDGSTFTLTDLQGQPVRLADLRGKAVWVNFWASWCPPCQAETPVLRQMDQAYRARGLMIVGISVQESSAADVAAYARTYDLGYTVAADLGGDIFHLYRVYALPTQFFIDTNGRIAAVVQGPLDQADASAQIEAILPKS